MGCPLSCRGATDGAVATGIHQTSVEMYMQSKISIEKKNEHRQKDGHLILAAVMGVEVDLPYAFFFHIAYNFLKS